MRRTFISVLTCAGLLLSACATVPMTSEVLDTAAKSFSVSPQKANIYVVRTSAMGAAVLMQITFDGRIVGSLAQKTYHLLAVDPGQHTVAVTTPEATDHVSLNTQAGKNYFLLVQPKMGWVAARASLKTVSEEEGRDMVLATKRAETMPF